MKNHGKTHLIIFDVDGTFEVTPFVQTKKKYIFRNAHDLPSLETPLTVVCNLLL
jgi:hypothetical protein